MDADAGACEGLEEGAQVKLNNDSEIERLVFKNFEPLLATYEAMDELRRLVDITSVRLMAMPANEDETRKIAADVAAALEKVAAKASSAATVWRTSIEAAIVTKTRGTN